MAHSYDCFAARGDPYLDLVNRAVVDDHQEVDSRRDLLSREIGVNRSQEVGSVGRAGRVLVGDHSVAEVVHRRAQSDRRIFEILVEGCHTACRLFQDFDCHIHHAVVAEKGASLAALHRNQDLAGTCDHLEEVLFVE